MKDWLRLIRLPLAPTAVCDSLACGLLALAAVDFEPFATPTRWFALACTSFLLYAFGMASNDLADRDVDRLKNPTRPLPSGRVSTEATTFVVVLLALGALMLSWLAMGEYGARTAGAAMLCAWLYNFLLKRFVLPGAVAMGLVRFFNASIFIWPLVAIDAVPWWLLGAPACIGLYSLSITVFSTTEDVESSRRVWTSRILAAVAFGGAATMAWVVGGRPTLGVAVAFGVASSTLFGRTPRPGPKKRQTLEMLLGLYWLAYVVATGTHDGSLAQWALAGLIGLPLAWGLAIASQLMIRWLARP